MRSWSLFVIIWTTVVYDLTAHWFWAGNGWLRALGARDFAGGAVVHMNAGFAALIASQIVGKRWTWNVADLKVTKPHNVPMLLTGAAFLFFGWFGFNSGSALLANGVAAEAFVATMIAGFTGMLTWAICEDFGHFNHLTSSGMAMGLITGLVVITPGAGYVKPILAIPYSILGVAGSFAVFRFKGKFLAADDCLDAFAVHGAGGMFGMILLGFFASSEINPDIQDGVFYGNGYQLAYQLAAVASILAVALVFNPVILWLLRGTPYVGLRIAHKSLEVEGMDVVTHNEPAYNFENLHAKE